MFGEIPFEIRFGFVFVVGFFLILFLTVLKVPGVHAPRAEPGLPGREEQALLTPGGQQHL